MCTLYLVGNWYPMLICLHMCNYLP